MKVLMTLAYYDDALDGFQSKRQTNLFFRIDIFGIIYNHCGLNCIGVLGHFFFLLLHGL